MRETALHKLQIDAYGSDKARQRVVTPRDTEIHIADQRLHLILRIEACCRGTQTARNTQRMLCPRSGGDGHQYRQQCILYYLLHRLVFS